MRGSAARTLERLKQERIIAVVRTANAECIPEVVAALTAGGIRCLEVTMTVPNAVDAIAEACKGGGDLVIGAGTVLCQDAAEECIAAGAQFLVSPICAPAVMQLAHRRGTVIIPGALTPNEIWYAWNCGADMVKVFPASRMGPAYIADVLAPLRDVLLLPTGGITDENAAEYLAAGAAAVCAGSWLIDSEAIRRGSFDVLEDKARRIVRAVSGI
ncbi:MAG: bifunctional 4-hydroxy-2-oxoglutarate aldolase/2-dehydro-3-deoxy-phosphogluconate aldolase [Candidatus Bipolaricaulis sp.]|nr:bifunctional 4-hydroxy-2-oxoglutarate aldolase/2-dehydro-3-deoxy-phosphogluconate aldolase [Candidatus Bipolaricaulis sp.]